MNVDVGKVIGFVVPSLPTYMGREPLGFPTFDGEQNTKKKIMNQEKSFNLTSMSPE